MPNEFKMVRILVLELLDILMVQLNFCLCSQISGVRYIYAFKNIVIQNLRLWFLTIRTFCVYLLKRLLKEQRI